MKIQTQDLYHGAVLTQITEHSSFKALNKVDSQYCHYLVNHDTRLFVKYLTKPYHHSILNLVTVNYSLFRLIWNPRLEYSCAKYVDKKQSVH